VTEVSGHLAAHANPLTTPVDFINNLFEKTEKAGMSNVRQLSHLGIIPINRKEILAEVVCPDAEEVQLGAKLLEDKSYGRNLDHDANRHARIEGNILGSKFIVQLGDLASQPEHFRECRDHGRHQLYSPKRRGANDGPELCANQVAMLGID